MRIMIFALTLMILSNVSQAAQVRFSATNGWYKKIYGTETIELKIDYDRNQVVLPSNPNVPNVYNFIFKSPRSIIAFAQDEGTTGSLLEINFIDMSLVVGDSFGTTYLTFGKYLQSSIVQK